MEPGRGAPPRLEWAGTLRSTTAGRPSSPALAPGQLRSSRTGVPVPVSPVSSPPKPSSRPCPPAIVTGAAEKTLRSSVRPMSGCPQGGTWAGCGHACVGRAKWVTTGITGRTVDGKSCRDLMVCHREEKDDPGVSMPHEHAAGRPLASLLLALLSWCF